MIRKMDELPETLYHACINWKNSLICGEKPYLVAKGKYDDERQ
ncbi:MAG TPA: hypothetical protein VGJ94_00785 [Syntrophorhabdaceae bacterium]|jgi:hypothetical protein